MVAEAEVEDSYLSLMGPDLHRASLETRQVVMAVLLVVVEALETEVMEAQVTS